MSPIGRATQVIAGSIIALDWSFGGGAHAPDRDQGMGALSEDLARLTSVSAPVRGRLGACGELIIATLDRRAHERLAGQAPLAGIGAFSKGSLESRWTAWNLPALASIDGRRIYAYSRGGLVVAFDPAGIELWRTVVPDDRSVTAQGRGDRDGPFVADVVPAGSSIYLAAGPEVLQLAQDTGRIAGRAAVCRSARGVVARLVRVRDEGVIATCTGRTGWDDEVAAEGPPLQPRPSLESRRTASGDVVALDFQLKERWRLTPPVAGLAYGDSAPVVLENGNVACVAARTMENAGAIHLDLFGGWIFVADGRTGAVQWRRETTSSVGQPDPVAVPGGVVAGFDTVFYALPDGTPRWTVRRDQTGLDSSVTPVVDGDRLLLVGRRGIQSVAIRDGRLSDVMSFGPHPFTGSVVTPLMLDGAILYVGLDEEGTTRLTAIRPPR